MNLNQRNCGGVGRGALLRRLAAESAGTSSSNSDESRSNNSASTSNESLLETSRATTSGISETAVTNTSTSTQRSQGRGHLLQRILRAQESVSNDECNLETAPRPFGRGRMLQMLAERNQQAELKCSESITSLDEGIEDLSLEEKPVIRKGNSG